MTLLRDVLTIPERVTDSDYVMKLADGVTNAGETLQQYVVTDSLRENFAEALGLVGQAMQTRRSQAGFLHGSFGAGKSHFMVVLHEILRGNKDARSIGDLQTVIADADRWLAGRKVLTLTYHLLGARSLEEAVLGGYRRQIMELRPDASPPAVHRSDGLITDAARLREDMGDERFFARLSGSAGGASGGSPAWGTWRGGVWDGERFAKAASQPPGSQERDQLASDLTATLFQNAVHSGEFLDIDDGLAVLTEHAHSLQYDAVVLFLDELILWLSQHLSNIEFVNHEGGKLAKLVESADRHRAVPLVSFVARQRDLVQFLGPHVPGAERQAFADVFRHGRGRFSTIELEERNLPVIAERRLLKPKEGGARLIDEAFAAVQRRRDVWDTLVIGNQYGDAGVGSDAQVFRRLYPFSPALVATLVSLSQALQRERTALKVMARLLTNGRDTLRVNDVIGVSAIFDELVGKGELPDDPLLRKHFEHARSLYRNRLRPLLLHRNGLTDATMSAAPARHQFHVDDKLIKTLLLAALVPDVPALANLTATRLHALNYGSFVSPVEGMEPGVIAGRLRALNADAPEVQVGDGNDPLIRVELSEVDYGAVLDRVPTTVDNSGSRQRLLRELVCAELGIPVPDGSLITNQYQREWRGRRHGVDVLFANVRNREELPDAEVSAQGGRWRLIIDYPFDDEQHNRRSDFARINRLESAGFESRTVFWLPLFLTDERLGNVGTLVKLNYILTGDDRLYTLAADLAPADRIQVKAMLEQQQRAVRIRLVVALRQAYGGAVRAQEGDVIDDAEPVLRTLDRGFQLDRPVGGTLKSALEHLTGQMLRRSFPGGPNLPEDAPLVRSVDVAKVLEYVRRAIGDTARRTVVDQADRATVQRVANPLKLGEYAEGVYACTSTLMWWTQHLLQQAKVRGYADRFPIGTLRELTDLPNPRGLDPLVQDLIIIAFALDQDLTWYRYDVSEPQPPLGKLANELELRPARLPDEEHWVTAVRVVGELLGLVKSPLRNASNLAALSRAAREGAKAVLPNARELVKVLERHAAQLGVDTAAETGRLATARRVAALLDQLIRESDDKALVELVAAADFGAVGARGASKYTAGAKAQMDALTRVSWTVIDVAASLRDHRQEAARTLMEKLADVARDEEVHAELAAALAEAERTAGTLLRAEPPPGPVQPPATVTPIVPPGAGSTPTVTVSPDPVLPPPALPGQRGEVVVRDADDLARASDEIRRALNANPGSTVRLTWAVE